MDEQLKRDAYLKGLQLKNTGLDEKIICVRLEKQGIPYDLAKEVAKNVFLQRKIDTENNEQVPAFGEGLQKWALGQIFVEIRNWFTRNKN